MREALIECCNYGSHNRFSLEKYERPATICKNMLIMMVRPRTASNAVRCGVCRRVAALDANQIAR
jgi:hypothetical protein